MDEDSSQMIAPSTQVQSGARGKEEAIGVWVAYRERRDEMKSKVNICLETLSKMGGSSPPRNFLEVNEEKRISKMRFYKSERRRYGN